jgi:hypothetical protein
MASNKSSSTSRIAVVVQKAKPDGPMGQQNVQDVTLYQAVISSPRVLGLCPALMLCPSPRERAACFVLTTRIIPACCSLTTLDDVDEVSGIIAGISQDWMNCTKRRDGMEGRKEGKGSSRTQRWLGRTNEMILVADTDLEMQTLLHLFIVLSANGCRK